MTVALATPLIRLCCQQRSRDLTDLQNAHRVTGLNPDSPENLPLDWAIR
ncbi:MAG: hypothetical protein ACFBSG_06910 [Leptolyngbyaceae cyanobacterium]